VREREPGEFVSDNEWDTRYRLIPERCPAFLAKVKEEVLKAGKYLNVIRQCGKDICVFPVCQFNALLANTLRALYCK